jgi:hypothetical protein
MTKDDRAASLWVISRYGLAWRYPAPRHRLGGLKNRCPLGRFKPQLKPSVPSPIEPTPPRMRIPAPVKISFSQRRLNHSTINWPCRSAIPTVGSARPADPQLKTQLVQRRLKQPLRARPSGNRHTVLPGRALFLHRFPVRAVALHSTTGTLMGWPPLHRF